MKKLSSKNQKWLKSFHIFFAAVWIGAGVCLIMMQSFLEANSGQMLYGINISMKLIDDFVIIPAAIGSLLTGLIYSIWTRWGFFKHNWIIVKWIINIGGIIFGTFWLGPWMNSMPPISESLGMKALSDAVYMNNNLMNQIFGSIQVATLIFAAFISVLKPWKKQKNVEKLKQT